MLFGQNLKGYTILCFIIYIVCVWGGEGVPISRTTTYLEDFDKSWDVICKFSTSDLVSGNFLDQEVGGREDEGDEVLEAVLEILNFNLPLKLLSVATVLPATKIQTLKWGEREIER